MTDPVTWAPRSGRVSKGVLAVTLTVVSLACSSANSPAGPSAPGSQADCLARAMFGNPTESPYVLPYPVAATFVVSQSYCNATGGHRDTFAYDWNMPLGAPITAARAGTVIATNDQFADDDNVGGRENNVFVEHADGTVVRYTHLQQGSISVAVGEAVVPGQRLGSNGASGNSGGVPHLHLEVFRSRSFAKSSSIPVNFRNADGVLDLRVGLVAGSRYTALPF